MCLDAFDARLPAGIDPGPHRGRRLVASGKIDKLARRLSAEHGVGDVAWIGVNVRTECFINVNSVSRIVERVRDLSIGKTEILSGFRKFFTEIVIPVDPTGPVRGKIGFAPSL